MTVVKSLLGLFAALAIALVLMSPARAHTAMLRASPDRDATAGGSVSFIDLEFLDPITDASVAVTYNGSPVPGTTTVVDGKVITFTLDQPLNEPGRYQVSYDMVSFDSDFTSGGFFFTFDPTAAQAPRIEAAGPGGLSSTTLALSGFGLIGIVGLLALFVHRIETRRHRQALEAIDDYETGDYYR